MTLVKIADSAWPPAAYPAVDGWGFYIGGNTPHVWTPQEVTELKKHVRYLLPIFTSSNPNVSQVAANAASIVASCTALGMPKGKLVAVDLEAAVNRAYMAGLDYTVSLAGWKLVAYGQLSTVTGNPEPSGGYWVGQWDGVADDPSWTGKQYEDAGDWDLSEFHPDSLWDLQPPVITPPVPPVVVPPLTLEEIMQIEVWSCTSDPRVYAVHESGKMLHINEIASLESILLAKPVQYKVSKETMDNLKTALGYTGP